MGKNQTPNADTESVAGHLRTQKHCARHRMVMISSSILFASKFEYGDPVGMKVIYKCFSCTEENHITFKD